MVKKFGNLPTFQAIIVLQMLWAVPSYSNTAVNDAKFWTARWNNHELDSSLFQLTGGLNDNITVYSEEQNLDLTTNKLYIFIRNAWSYTVKTYGIFGNDPNLNLVMHHGESSVLFHDLSVNIPNEFNSRNLLDLGSRQNWLSVTTRSTDMDTILEHLAYFVEFSYKNRYGSPSYNIWKKATGNGLETAWNHIFTYDVYTKLKMTQHSTRYTLKHQKRSETTSSERALYWFRDWTILIYRNYGGSKVLQSYAEILHTHFPKNGQNYARGLNLGEFVHFWSGAVKLDLKQMATNVFGWNITFSKELESAREDFPEVSKLYSYQIFLTISDGNFNWQDLSRTTETKVDESSTMTTTATADGNKNSTFKITTPARENNVAEVPKDSITVQDHILAIGGTVVLLLVLGLVACVVFQTRKVKKLSVPVRLTLATEVRNLTDQEVKEFFEGDPDVDPESNYALVQSKPFIRDFEVPRNYITLDPTRVLGKGQFGSVVSGSLCVKDDEWLTVAVKTVKENVDVDYFQAFLSEVKIMAYIGRHTNIVELRGTCATNIKNCEILIALEFCPLGNLQNYLKKNRNIFEDAAFTITTTLLSSTNTTEASLGNKITTVDLLTWSQEIANGMTYLTEKKVIHGDLAARNVLLTNDRVAKISDFGLSRQFLNYANYQKTSTLPLPWRWLAVESLKEMEFSVASDVWAFGVTMWKIFSLAELPYSCWSWDLHFVDKLMSGDRLLRPVNANPDVYKLMMDCWKLKPADRPPFLQIRDTLSSHIFQLANKTSCICNEHDVTVHVASTSSILCDSCV